MAFVRAVESGSFWAAELRLDKSTVSDQAPALEIVSATGIPTTCFKAGSPAAQLWGSIFAPTHAAAVRIRRPCRSRLLEIEKSVNPSGQVTFGERGHFEGNRRTVAPTQRAAASGHARFGWRLECQFRSAVQYPEHRAFPA
jgi:hypothetical protein